jgi:hypothetical protein
MEGSHERSHDELIELGQSMERGYLADLEEDNDRILNLEKAIRHFVNLHPEHRAYFATATGITHDEGVAA